MRDAFDAARAAGTNLAFMNSNAAYWQIRYEDGGRSRLQLVALDVPDLLASARSDNAAVSG
jgi:hypothetical protein